MPHLAGYDPTKPGLDEARLWAIQALIISKLDLINTAMGRDDKAPMPPIKAKVVKIGDTESGWDFRTGGPIRIRISGGGESDGLDFEAKGTMGRSGNTGWEYKFSTNIYVYIHPHCFPGDDVELQAERREIAKARLSDWLTFGVFNWWDEENDTGGTVIDLTSNIMTPPGSGTDALLDGTIERAYKGNVPKAFSEATWTPTLHLVHTGTVE